jgi:hypothetical protein
MKEEASSYTGYDSKADMEMLASSCMEMCETEMQRQKRASKKSLLGPYMEMNGEA